MTDKNGKIIVKTAFFTKDSLNRIDLLSLLADRHGTGHGVKIYTRVII